MNAPSPAKHPRSWVRAALAAIIAVKLWLVCAQPVVAIGGAGHDDRLYLELARQLIEGNWLGSYSQFTLMKGPMYSFFIAGTFLLGIPLPLAQHLLYLGACLVLLKALRPLLRHNWQECLLFLLLAWQPMSYELPVLGRVLRQNIYTPTVLLLFAGLCALETRRNSPAALRAGWGLLLGLSFAALWLTREESVWCLPAIVLLIAAAAWRGWRAQVTPLLVAAGSGLLVIGGVSFLNYRHYQWFGTVEFRAPEFAAAYGALQRPITTEEIPYVSVTRTMRLRLYEVSPAFAELRPSLEGDNGLAWANASSGHTGLDATQREIAGGWFMWALRDAVAAAGHAGSARDALAFYGRIADEVNRACDEDRLGAVRPRRDTLMPPWRAEHSHRLRRDFPDYLFYFLSFRGFSARADQSFGPAGALMLFRDFTRWHLAPSVDAPELDRPLQQRFDRARLSALQFLGTAFAWICGGVAASGVPALCWFAVRVIRARAGAYRLMFTLAALGSAFAVMLINFLVHITSFSNQSPGALAQAYPLLVLFGVLAWFGATDRAPAGPD